MTIFDQRGQVVTYQYNSAGNVNFGSVSNVAQLGEQLARLRDEVARAREGKALDEESAADVDYHLGKAARGAAADGERPAILEHLGKVKTFLEKAGPAALGLLKGVVEAIGLARKLFE
jgi:hypothetical protein